MSTSELGESFISVLWQNITLLVFPPYTMLTMSEKKKKFTVYSFFMNNAWGKYDTFLFCIFPINNNISSMRYFQGNLRLTCVKYLSEEKELYEKQHLHIQTYGLISNFIQNYFTISRITRSKKSNFSYFELNNIFQIYFIPSSVELNSKSNIT